MRRGLNHGWHVALQPNARGLSTLPTAAGDGRTFTLTLDLCRHAIVLWVSDEAREEVPLNAGSVAALHQRLIAMLERHGLPSDFNGTPERDRRTRCRSPRTQRRGTTTANSADALPRSARGDAAGVRALPRRASRARRARCISGGAASTSRSAASRAAPRRRIRAACRACPTGSRAKPTATKCRARGFWAGGVDSGRAFFYSYIYPEPDGYRAAKVAHGRFDETFGEFVLPYAEVRASNDPERDARRVPAIGLRGRQPTLRNGIARRSEREPVAP